MTHPAALEAAAHEVRRAVVVAGPQPHWHRSVMARHRAEWPSLWEAIDRLVAVLDRDGPPADDAAPRTLSAGARITHEYVSAGDEAGPCVFCGKDRRHAVHVGEVGHG